MFLNFIILLIIVTHAKLGFANTHIGGDLGLIQDKKSISSRDSAQATFFDMYVYSQANKKYPLYIGIDYIYVSTAQPDAINAATTATLVSSNIMAGLKYVFGKKELYSIGVFGNPYIQASYQVTGSARDQWSGSTFATKLSIHPELSSSIKLCASLVYQATNYTSKKDSSGSTTVNSFSRTFLIPTVGLQFIF